MSISIFAARFEDDEKHGRILAPAIDVRHWGESVVADDADARIERDEDPFVPNPDYIPNAEMSLSSANAHMLFSQLGFVIGDEGVADFPIDEVQRAALRGLNGSAARYTEDYQAIQGETGPEIISFGVAEGYMEKRLAQLLALIATGRRHGATHVLMA